MILKTHSFSYIKYGGNSIVRSSSWDKDKSHSLFLEIKYSSSYHWIRDIGSSLLFYALRSNNWSGNI
jgi:hypothetical protein